MKLLALFLPLMLALPGILFQDSVHVTGATTRVVEAVDVPPLPTAASANVTLTGASYHELQIWSLGGGAATIGPRTYAEAVYVDTTPAIEIVHNYPAIQTSYLPPGTILILIWFDEFVADERVDPALFHDGAYVQFAGNSLLGGVSRGPNVRISSWATHTFDGTVTVSD